MNRAPAYDLRASSRDEVLSLFEENHGYKSLSNSLTYCFAVFEDGKPVAAYAWQPPAVGAAKAVCPEAPQATLSLSRMVAAERVDRGGTRRLKHISKPLRRQMRHLIDRTRWPVLVTYSDEGEGHNGYVYECSGWTPTERNKRPVFETVDGARASSYSNGRHGSRDLIRAGSTWVQRWEHRACPEGEADLWMLRAGWRRRPLEGRVWKSGNQAHTWVMS